MAPQVAFSLHHEFEARASGADEAGGGEQGMERVGSERVKVDVNRVAAAELPSGRIERLISLPA